VAEEDDKKGGHWNADGRYEVEADPQPARGMHEQNESAVIGVDHGHELIMHPLLRSKRPHGSYALVSTLVTTGFR